LAAALLAISRRLSGVIRAALALPLRLPSAAAADLGGIGHILGFLAGRDPHDANGVADHISRALLASRPRGIYWLELVLRRFSRSIFRPNASKIPGRLLAPAAIGFHANHAKAAKPRKKTPNGLIG